MPECVLAMPIDKGQGALWTNSVCVCLCRPVIIIAWLMVVFAVQLSGAYFNLK